MLPLLPFLLLLTLYPNSVTSELVLDDGYSVSTVLDFNKRPATVHPFALLPRHRSQDLLLLDSSDSAFYSLPIPISQGIEVSLFSGKGGPGFSDGDPTATMFHSPRSFAIDSRDNVYVADRTNHAIRKISRSGVTTTIAGGYSNKTGRIDGPAQNASFSADFELVYVPTICALLISDRGNRLIRQMDLKPEDCAQKSQSGLGVAPVSVIAVLCVLFGSVFGFVARPFFSTREVSSNHFINKTWKHYRTNLGRLVLMTCSGVRNAVANSTLSVLMLRLVNLSLCYLSVVFQTVRHQYGRKTPFKANYCREFREPVSLLESDVASDHGVLKTHNFVDRLEELISFDEGMGVLEVNRSSIEQKDKMEDGSKGSSCKIDDMIRANLSDFGDQNKQEGQIVEFKSCSSGLVQRRLRDGRSELGIISPMTQLPSKSR